MRVVPCTHLRRKFAGLISLALLLVQAGLQGTQVGYRTIPLSHETSQVLLLLLLMLMLLLLMMLLPVLLLCMLSRNRFIIL